MHAWVKDQGLEVPHACLPEPTAYTVIESTDPDPAPRGKTMLFLGEKGKNQAWARFWEFNKKGDEIDYLHVDLSSGAVEIEKNIKRLAITCTPLTRRRTRKLTRQTLRRRD
jgi:hypothetical protein